MAHHLLIVDDEDSVLSMLNDLFSNRGYEITLTTSSKQALDFLQDTKVDLVMTDYRMPDMDGVEFLQQAQILCPDAVRILLTAHGNLQVAMAAINDANVYKFVTKPWHNRDLLLTVQRALEHHDLILQQRIVADTLELMLEENTMEVERLRQALKEMAHKIRGLVS